MTTVKTRINISLPNDVREALTQMARRDRVPQATKAARLLEIGLDIEEDQMLDVLAKRRDTKNARYIQHGKAWK